MIYPNNLEINRSIDKLLLGIIALNDLRKTSQQKYKNDSLNGLRQSLKLIFKNATGCVTASDIIEIQGDRMHTIDQGTIYGTSPDLVIDSRDTGLLMLRFMGSSVNPDPSIFIIDPLTVIDLQAVPTLDN